MAEPGRSARKLIFWLSAALQFATTDSLLINGYKSIAAFARKETET